MTQLEKLIETGSLTTTNACGAAKKELQSRAKALVIGLKKKALSDEESRLEYALLDVGHFLLQAQLAKLTGREYPSASTEAIEDILLEAYQELAAVSSKIDLKKVSLLIRMKREELGFEDNP